MRKLAPTDGRTKAGCVPAGFTLLETLIGMTILVIVSSGLYLSYSNTLDIVTAGQYHATAANIIESEVEIIRNMRYEDVGTVGGVPPGLLPPSKAVTVGGVPFTVETTVRNIDDPFDGLLDGTPGDTDPADYKIIELRILCASCPRFSDIRMTTTLAPRNLEDPSKTGYLLVRVLDGSGIALPGATITVTNTGVTPAVNITDTSDADGLLQLIGLATDSAGYRVTVTKAGYSTDRTYPPGEPSNPNPAKPDLTIVAEQLTVATFSIDVTGDVAFTSRSAVCGTVPGVDFLLTGSKLIGSAPDIPKYSVSHQTGAGGTVSVSPLEWDSFTARSTDASWDIAGTSHPSPFTLNPGSSLAVTWLMAPKDPSSLLVTVTGPGGTPLNDAAVRLASGAYDVTVVSGRNTWSQSDWSGGQFSQQSGGIYTASAGVLTLIPPGGPHATGSYAWLESETVDFGTASISFFSAGMTPSSQPSETGTDSVRLQIATNNDNATWVYAGPDGTPATFYTGAGGNLPTLHNGNRYLRYRVEMRTLDQDATPSLEAVGITYRAGCLPGGNAFFSGLANDTYTLTVTKSGFSDYNAEVPVIADWQGITVPLNP
ncbi:MAG TPA: prepilin-type N-terminal cleavage/methylation domain-containing protein [Candidatus Paceibacterota bacterium]|nr:prepilin-type N-terminal cleavage/methylation domain-containing protein [Candidatus Paceibacterota bacterium]